MPLSALRDELDALVDLQDELQRLARRFKVSTLVILRRIHDAGRLTRDELWAAYEEELAKLRASPRGSRGNFYLTLGASVSKRFARALVVSTLEGRIAITESYRMLGLKKMKRSTDSGAAWEWGTDGLPPGRKRPHCRQDRDSFPAASQARKAGQKSRP